MAPTPGLRTARSSFVPAADAYVSPVWYPAKAEHGRVVPTWNYVTAHIYGHLVVHDDPTRVDSVVRRLTSKHEAGSPHPWSVDDAPPEFIAAQLRAIVGVELVITRIEPRPSSVRTDRRPTSTG